MKTALVTGAARGIGLAIARRFLAEGWNVALLDINAPQLRETMEALATPSKTLELICDVSDAPSIAAAVHKAAAHFGRLDALVNNAGIAIFKPILETTPEDWARTLAVNLTGPFLSAQAAAPIMAEAGGGAMVNITSISGLTLTLHSSSTSTPPCPAPSNNASSAILPTSNSPFHKAT